MSLVFAKVYGQVLGLPWVGGGVHKRNLLV